MIANIHIHLNIHMHMQIHVHIQMHTCTCTYIHTYMHACMHACMYSQGPTGPMQEMARSSFGPCICVHSPPVHLHPPARAKPMPFSPEARAVPYAGWNMRPDWRGELQSWCRGQGRHNTTPVGAGGLGMQDRTAAAVYQ